MDGGDGVQEHRLEDDAVGPAGEFGNLGELIEKPGKQRGGRGRRGLMCYDRIKQSVRQEELFRGLGSQRVTPHRPAESLVLLRKADG